MEKLHMVRERRIEGERLPNGHTADRYVYSIFWREWQRRGKRAA